MSGNEDTEQSKLTLPTDADRVETTAGDAELIIMEVEFKDYTFDGEPSPRIQITGVIEGTEELRKLFIPRPKTINSVGRTFLSQIYNHCGLDADAEENDVNDLVGHKIPVTLSKVKVDDGNTYDRLKWVSTWEGE